MGSVIIAVSLSAAALIFHPFGPLGRQIWPPSDLCPIPTADQFPLCALLAFIEAAAFGAGVSFLIFGHDFIAAWFSDVWRARCVHIGISWQMANWWMHDSAHIHVGLNLYGVLIIDYVFHVTLIMSSFAMLLAFMVRPSGVANAARQGL